DLAHRMVCSGIGRSRHLFWLPPAHPACVAGIIVSDWERVPFVPLRDSDFAFCGDCQALANRVSFPHDERSLSRASAPDKILSFVSHTSLRGQSDDSSNGTGNMSPRTLRIRDDGSPGSC